MDSGLIPDNLREILFANAGLTQSELAECLGLTQKTVSQYEKGLRVPGPTVQVVMKTLDRVKPNQFKTLLELIKGKIVGQDCRFLCR